MVKITQLEAVRQGFVVDSSIYPPFAYKGARFKPDEWRLCYTDSEADLRAIVILLLSQVDFTVHACSFSDAVGTVLDTKIIDRAKAVLLETMK